jgi:hypothetical protein
MGGRTTKAEYFREHAERLRTMARYVRRDSRTKLSNLACHLEELAKAAESETGSSSAMKIAKLKKKVAAARP